MSKLWPWPANLDDALRVTRAVWDYFTLTFLRFSIIEFQARIGQWWNAITCYPRPLVLGRPGPRIILASDRHQTTDLTCFDSLLSLTVGCANVSQKLRNSKVSNRSVASNVHSTATRLTRASLHVFYALMTCSRNLLTTDVRLHD